MNKYCLYILVVCFALTACDKPPQTKAIQALPDSTLGGVFIVNEGNYTQSNATLGFIDYSTNKTYDNVFESKNNRKLGDVFQSMTVINDNAYLVINNSGKVEVINAKTFQSVNTIKGLRSPRYICKTSYNKIYVSDLYANKISVVDLSTYETTKTIDLFGWSEEMLSYKGKTYVTNVKTNHISIIDELTDQITDSIATPFAPKSIVQDSAHNLWVLCGDVNATDKKHFILQVDINTQSIIHQWQITTPQTAASKLHINKAGNTLFWIDEGIFKMGIYEQQLPTQAFIEKAGRLFYGFNIDNKRNQIWVSDVKDFNTTSDIYRYDFNGSLVEKLNGGKITSDFYFYAN
ncbi:MAG: DUF5074 domain-containing protein [Bacteroidota bacterium]